MNACTLETALDSIHDANYNLGAHRKIRFPRRCVVVGRSHERQYTRNSIRNKAHPVRLVLARSRATSKHPQLNGMRQPQTRQLAIFATRLSLSASLINYPAASGARGMCIYIRGPNTPPAAIHIYCVYT
jgi:hypothetical protein